MKHRFYRTIRIAAIGLLIGITLAVVLAPKDSYADDDLACAALFPCDEFNELLPQYEGSSDPCALKFAALCKDLRIKSHKQCSDVSEQFNSVQLQLDTEQLKVTKLKKTIRKLRNKK